MQRGRWRWLGPGLLVVASCADAELLKPAPVSEGRPGASIAIVSSTGELAVVNPDQGSVSFLDAASLAPLAEVDVGGEPHALVELSSGDLLVSNYRGGEVVLVDPGKHAVTARQPVCAGPWGLSTEAKGTGALVACEWEGAVLRLDPKTLAATTVATGLTRPRAVASIEGSIYVAELTGGRVKRVAGDGSITATSLVPAAASYRPALTRMTANLGAALWPAFGRLHVAHELVNHDGEGNGELVAGDYGSVGDDRAKINPAVSSLLPGADEPLGDGDPPALYARFDGGSRQFNGPAALASFGDHYLLVADLSSNDVAVLDASAATPGDRAVGSFAVGAGPAGIAVDEKGKVAFVDNAFDGSVSRLDLTTSFASGSPRVAAELTVVRALASRYSAAALAGRKLFHDASNTHVTPSAVVACSTCHPAGGDDGLVWFIHTDEIPLKRRRTPHLANAHSATAPYHWDGSFTTMPALVDATITGLMAGDGLLVDPDLVQSYLDEMVEAPLPPLSFSRDAAAIARGREVFTSEGAGCSTCHAGADGTDGGFHAVLSPMSLHADDVFTTANTPALHGLFLRAPYFHDGRSPSLEDLLTRSDAEAHGGARGLSAKDRSDLLAYLRSL